MTSDTTFPRRFGKYKLLAELAQGGMGAVYLAASGARGMEKVCALKVVLPSLATPEYCGRFMDEAKVMVRLSHGNLVQVFDVGEVDEEAYIAMEYVEGQDLRSIWNRCVEVRRAFPVDVAIHLLKEVCFALAYAHSYEGLRLVHRDISPPNIMATYSGETKVMDFGLAYSAIKLEHTSPGLVFGKVPYMSPEQARGDELDGRTDLYAVGVVLWELLTGKRLFPSGGDQAKEITDRANNPVVQSTREFTRRVPPKLDELVCKALSAAPSDRFASAEEMSAALGRFLSTNWPGTDNHRVGSFLSDLFAEERVKHRQRLESLLAEAAVLDDPVSADSDGAGANDPPEEEQLFDGRYRLGKKLGEGGMGEVFEAEHEAIGKSVAVKVLHRGYGKSKDVVARFKREARAASRIDHQGITDVTDFGVTEDKRLYFVMELLQGRLLSQVLDVSGALSLAEAVDIGLQLCSAMTAAHEAGLVHRDLKPDNIILVPRKGGTEQVKILDFGIAKELGPSDQAEMLTRPGTTLGTPEYMAPEQAAGQAADARSDVYATGVLLYEILCGEPPHTGTTAKEVLLKKLQEPIEPIDQRRVGLPEELSAVITRCLSASPDARPRSMREVALVLERVKEEFAGQPLEPIPASVMSLPGGVGRSGFKRRAATTEIVERHQGGGQRGLILVLGGLAVILLVGLLFAFRPWKDRPGDAGAGAGGNAAGKHGPTAAAAAMGTMDPVMAPGLGLGDASTGAPAMGTMNPRGHHRAGMSGMSGMSGMTEPGTGPGVVEPPVMNPPGVGHDGGAVTPMVRATVSRKSRRERALALLKAARGQVAAGRWAAARQSLLEAGQIRGYRGRALTGLARLSFQRGRYADAARSARRATSAGGGTSALLVLANSQLKLGQYAAAAATYRRILKRRPNHGEAKHYLALALRRLGK